MSEHCDTATWHPFPGLQDSGTCDCEFFPVSFVEENGKYGGAMVQRKNRRQDTELIFDFNTSKTSSFKMLPSKQASWQVPV